MNKNAKFVKSLLNPAGVTIEAIDICRYDYIEKNIYVM